MCNFTELVDKVPNKEFDHLTRLLSSGCPVTWGSESNTCETRADVGTTNHVESISEDGDINDLGPVSISSPPQHSPTSHQEHAHISSLPNSFHLEERPVETPVWLTKLRAHLDQKFSSMESKFKEDVVRLEAKIDTGESKRDADFARLESKIDLLIVTLEQQHDPNHRTQDDSHDKDQHNGFYFDDEDRSMYHMTPHTSIDEQANGEQGGTEVDHDETDVQQQTRVEPTNVERPKRIQKCSHYFASRYTNPCSKRRYHRDEGLVYNPLREIPKEK